MKKKTLFIALTLIIIFHLISPRIPVNAQSETSLIIDSIDTTNFPKVEIYFSILDHQGFPIPDLIGDNISLSEDGQIVSNFELTPVYQHPLDIVMVVDTSTTMGFGDQPTPIINLTSAARNFVNSLAPSDQLALVTISNDADLVQELTTDKNTLLLALDNLVPEGDSVVNDGIMEAILTLEGKSSRPIIVLLIDGMDSGLSEYSLEEISNYLIQRRIPIYIISWRDSNQDELGKMTDLVHGEMQFLPDYFPNEQSFQGAFNNLSDSLVGARQQYLLSFTSGLAADGIEHEAHLGVDFLNSHAETSRNFSAEPGNVEIELMNLANDQTVSGNVKIIPTVDAPAELARIDILLDGTPLDSDQNPPYEYTWDSTKVDPGSHAISIIATDRVGNSGQIDFNVIVEKPITIHITDPLDGETVSGSTTILMDIVSNLGVDQVELFVDNALEKTITSEPYKFEWDLSEVTAGNHAISVIATDSDGFSAEDQIFLEVVPGDNLEWLIVIIAAVGAAAILIPVGMRARRKRSSQKSTGAEKVASGGVQLPDTGQIILRELHGLNPNQVWSLASNEIRMGRKRSENDIPLMGLKASREQGAIRFEQGQYVIFSLKSDNPIMVNDQPVDQHVLQPGDLIRGGESVFRFEIQGS